MVIVGAGAFVFVRVVGVRVGFDIDCDFVEGFVIFVGDFSLTSAGSERCLSFIEPNAMNPNRRIQIVLK
jgi:hypothetical protein